MAEIKIKSNGLRNELKGIKESIDKLTGDSEPSESQAVKAHTQKTTVLLSTFRYYGL